MADEATQAAASVADAGATPSTEATGAQDLGNDLEKFLSDYEEQTRPQPQQPTQLQQPTTSESEMARKLADLEAWKQQQEFASAQAREKADLDEATKTVKGEIAIPDAAVRGWLQELADKKPDMHRIWANRANDPRAAKAMLAAAAKEFAKSDLAKLASGRIDQDATDTRAAVAAAVRGASTAAPDKAPSNLGSMTDAEFREYARQSGINPGI